MADLQPHQRHQSHNRAIGAARESDVEAAFSAAGSSLERPDELAPDPVLYPELEPEAELVALAGMLGARVDAELMAEVAAVGL